MKFLLLILFLFGANFCFAGNEDSTLLASHSEPVNEEDCSCKGKKLYGKVKVVDSYSSADFLVYVDNSYTRSNIRVYVSSEIPSDCGIWHFTDSYSSADFTVKFVDAYSSADFAVYFVDSYTSAGTK